MKNYTKADIEVLILSQLATLEAAQEQLRLIREQNDLLLAEISQLKAQAHPVKPYRNPKAPARGRRHSRQADKQQEEE